MNTTKHYWESLILMDATQLHIKYTKVSVNVIQRVSEASKTDSQVKSIEILVFIVSMCTSK